MDIFWLEAAIADLDEIVEYIAARNPIAAPKVAGALRAAAIRLGNHPRMGRSGRVAGTRELVVSRFPFVIAYRIVTGRVEVVRVIHSHRDWSTAFRERG